MLNETTSVQVRDVESVVTVDRDGDIVFVAIQFANGVSIGAALVPSEARKLAKAILRKCGAEDA